MEGHHLIEELQRRIASLESANADLERRNKIQMEGEIRTVLDSLPFYVMLIDAKHHIILANRVFTEIFGIKPGEEVGEYCPRLAHGLDTPFPGCPLEEAVRSDVGVEKELFDEAKGRWMQSGVYPTAYRTGDGRKAYLHLARDITDHTRIAEDLKRNLQEQSAMAALLIMSLSPGMIEEILQTILDKVLELPWLDINRRGAVFIMNDDPGMLQMVAKSGLAPSQLASCARIPFGRCLCGLAAQTRQIVYADRIDGRHEVTYDGILDHGHYCVPIISRGEVLGVLNTYRVSV